MSAKVTLTDVERHQMRRTTSRARIPEGLVQAVESIVAARVAEALAAAADKWQQGEWSDALSGTQRPTQVQARLATAQAVTDWLRALANEYAPDGATA